MLNTIDDTAKLIVLAAGVVAEWDQADPNRRLRKLSVEKSDRAMKELEASLQQQLDAPAAAAAALQQHLAADVGQLRDALDRVVEERRKRQGASIGSSSTPLPKCFTITSVPLKRYALGKRTAWLRPD